MLFTRAGFMLHGKKILLIILFQEYRFILTNSLALIWSHVSYWQGGKTHDIGMENSFYNVPTLFPFSLNFAELLLCHYRPSRDHWWEARDIGDRVICGGCARWEYKGWNMLLCGSPYQLQPQVPDWCLRAFSCAWPDRTN